MTTPRNILMIAAENGAIPGGKVGGIGDVVRDVPPVLAERGMSVTVFTPSYGSFADLPGSRRIAVLEVGFRGMSQHVDLYDVPVEGGIPEVRHLVADHPQFGACGSGRIYCDDPVHSPFATDATKFAFFCGTVAEALAQSAVTADVLHLHDWHAALLLVLRRYHPAFRSLRDLYCVYTIHNLALQGVRPLSGNPSSLESWFPGMTYEPGVVTDPRWNNCVNPMAVGIRLADAVHTVSPTYAEEIVHPSAVETRGYYGGEGLEADLEVARNERRLFGILNGCEYPTERRPGVPDWPELLKRMRAQVLHWAGHDTTLAPAQFIAQARLSNLAERTAPDTILTSVGRITDQKMRLLNQQDARGRPALEGILEQLGPGGVYLLLGSGDPAYEHFLTTVSSRYDNFVFLRGYSDELSRALYGAGDLFLMPSSFEPCGISQMLAMRAGQPCLVHHVGGLKDTVRDGINGFAFVGASLEEQAERLVAACAAALKLRRNEPKRWAAIRDAAASARFSWQDSIDQYVDCLYRA